MTQFGFYFTDPVTVEIASGGVVRRVPFSTDLFDFDPRHFDAVPSGPAEGSGFSGLRLRHPINALDRLDEVLVLQGGSYFRAIGRDMGYGLSARALAIGTGGPVPEIFPTFELLRAHPPRAAGGPARIEALIDSPRRALTSTFSSARAPRPSPASRSPSFRGRTSPTSGSRR